MTPRHAPFGHDNGAPACIFAKMGPDLVALEDAGRIGEDHNGVGCRGRLRTVGAAGPELFLYAPEFALFVWRKRTGLVRCMVRSPRGRGWCGHSPDPDPPTMNI